MAVSTAPSAASSASSTAAPRAASAHAWGVRAPQSPQSEPQGHALSPAKRVAKPSSHRPSFADAHVSSQISARSSPAQMPVPSA